MRYFIQSIFIFLLITPLTLFADEFVNINTADVHEFVTNLTGVTEETAQAIIDYRNTNGPFPALESVLNVEGIERDFLNINKDYLHVGGMDAPDINS